MFFSLHLTGVDWLAPSQPVYQCMPARTGSQAKNQHHTLAACCKPPFFLAIWAIPQWAICPPFASLPVSPRGSPIPAHHQHENRMKEDTRLIHAGRNPRNQQGAVNPPVYRASTVVFSDLKSYMERSDEVKYDGFTYGARHTPTTQALADACATLEGGHKAVITATGLSAVTQALTAFLKAGDHALIADTVYGPCRNFCDKVLTRFGVDITYYDPTIGEGIGDLMRPNTRVVYTESPGSLTFEMQDIPAMAKVAHDKGALVLMDNTWGAGLFYKPFEHGVDVSIQAGTKYINGHADVVIGTITAKDETLWRQIKDGANTFGDVAGPDECYLALRGLRTIAPRMRTQQAACTRITTWLEGQPGIRRVLWPALPSDPGHALWKRDFTGAASLFGLVLDTTDLAAVARMTDGLRLFGIGSSWGGYESLVSVNPTEGMRTAVPWQESPFLMRMHIGLEDPDDLLQDLEDGLKRLRG